MDCYSPAFYTRCRDNLGVNVVEMKNKKRKLTPPAAVVVYEQDEASQRAGSPGTPLFGWDELGRFVTGIRMKSLIRRMREREEGE